MSRKPFVVTERCTRACSLHPDNLPFAPETLAWYNERRTISWMIAESDKLGRKLSQAALSRHRRHLEEESEVPEVAGESGGTVDHLRVLEQIILKGAKNADSWRVGVKDTMDAMKLYYTLTQGSAMRDLFAALTAVAAGEDPDEVETDAGSLSPAELESVDVELT